MPDEIPAPRLDITDISPKPQTFEIKQKPK